ncbi:hypothetical protein BKA66DRAFT_25838 [Pyrenochaeta sp. MPI-SDFR-AT-0127]|nr:hypothetical protein BKA66DRAFT_25838 [Pyrenochaeta sp. MPI-SDFR-AT-0127]
MARFVQSNAHFLKRDALYEIEKPYSLRFAPPEGFPRANIKLENHNIDIHDIRGSRSMSFKKDGVEVINFDSKLKYEDFDDDEVVKEIFLLEVANTLKALLQAQHIQIFEHTIRKQHETFPISTGLPYQYNQPTSIAHVDTTVGWALDMTQQLNADKASEITNHRVQCVNFWKPLKGPVKNWPLAMCDPDTINPDTDLEPCDLVYPDYVVENRQLYHSDKQRWFYLSNQMPNEAWVFLQSDTNNTTKPVPHTAFPVTEIVASDDAIRESIEVRALAFYGGFEHNPGNEAK